jgi:TIR domain
MDVFICWSGASSHVLAEGLRQWLPRVIQPVRPFFSDEDIRKGRRWGDEIKGRLEKANFAILCMTPDNLTAPWIHFEAGAVSKHPGVSHVTALLLRVKPSDLVGPLTQFQHTLPTKGDVWKLVQSVNSALDPERRIEAELIEWAFKREWPDFEKLVQQAEEALKETPAPAPPHREQQELLEELLTLVRDLHREQPEIGRPVRLESDTPLTPRGGRLAIPNESGRKIAAFSDWRMAASLLGAGIIGASGGWVGKAANAMDLDSIRTVVFNLPTVSRGSDECTTVRVAPDTRLAVLRVPGLSRDLRVVVLNSEKRELPADEYTSRIQQDGSQLLWIDAQLLAGRGVQLQARRANGSGEPLGCVTGEVL